MSESAEDALADEPASSQGGPGPPGLFHYLLKARYLAAVVVALAILHSLMFLFLGAHSAFVTYWHVLSRTISAGERPGLELLHSLDFLLVSLVLLIFALGVANLFLRPTGTSEQRSSPLPSWLHVESFGDLKYLLWETILTTLLIAALPMLATDLFTQLDWSSLFIPATILLLALSLFFMRRV
jgi:uncharacterized membrane protein YqhA